MYGGSNNALGAMKTTERVQSILESRGPQMGIVPSAIQHNILASINRLREVNIMSQGNTCRSARTPNKHVPEENSSNSYRSKSRSRLAGRGGRRLGQQLSREETLWFMSLPEKVQRQSFTKEERILLKTACEIALLDVLDETYWSHGTLPRLDRPIMADFGDNLSSLSLGLAALDDASSGSSPFLPVFGSASPGLARFPSSAVSRRHVRSNSSASRNFSLPFPPHSESEHGDGKVASWLADTVSMTSRGSMHGTSNSKPQFYQDQETRMKLHRHLTTAEAFDEALGFSFLADDSSASISPDSVFGRSRSTSMPSQDERQEHDFKDRRWNDTPSLGGVNSEGPVSTGLSDSSVVTPSSSYASQPIRLRTARSMVSLRPPDRDMTLRMTLTRPEVRSPENELCGWQQEEQGSVRGQDPWALEQLPWSDDTTGKRGAFSAAGTGGKKSRKVWNILGRK